MAKPVGTYDPDREREPWEVTKGRWFAEMRDNPTEPMRVAEEPVTPVGDREYEDDDRDDLNQRNLFGESRIDEDYRLGGWE